MLKQEPIRWDGVVTESAATGFSAALFMAVVNRTNALCDAYGLNDLQRGEALRLAGECMAKGGAEEDCMKAVEHLLESRYGPLPDDVVPLEDPE